MRTGFAVISTFDKVSPAKSVTEQMGATIMLTATAPRGGGATLPEPDTGLVGLLDAAPATQGIVTPCQANDPDMWFAETPAELDRAKAMCLDCPVRAQCLAGALARHEPWGVWGGQIFERGTVIARKRPRGRPRKDDRQPEVLPTVQPVRTGQEAAA
jgi:WhiB family redox-sensing transcriptional regulator